jgi:hypothetical protein
MFCAIVPQDIRWFADFTVLVDNRVAKSRSRSRHCVPDQHDFIGIEIFSLAKLMNLIVEIEDVSVGHVVLLALVTSSPCIWMHIAKGRW